MSVDKQMRQAFEEVTTRNVNSVVEFSKGTRKVAKEAQDNTNGLKSLVIEMQKDLVSLQQAVAQLRAKIYFLEQKGGNND